MLKAPFLHLLIWVCAVSSSEAFLPTQYKLLQPAFTNDSNHFSHHIYPRIHSRSSNIQLNIPLSMIFGKLFEDSGPLGKGITVGKVQVALSIQDRHSPSSIFKLLARSTRNVGDSNKELSRMAHEVCLALLRNSDKWVGACSSSQWFSQNDGGKAETLFNDWVNREAMKFEKV